MKKVIKITFVAAFAAIAGYGVYANQKADAMSDLMLTNVEALATREQPNTDDCTPSSSNCWALHPTDSSRDKVRENAKW